MHSPRFVAAHVSERLRECRSTEHLGDHRQVLEKAFQQQTMLEMTIAAKKKPGQLWKSSVLPHLPRGMTTMAGAVEMVATMIMAAAAAAA